MADGYISLITLPNNNTYLLKDSEKISAINASGTAPLTLSSTKSGTTYTLTGSVADASFTTSGIVNTSTLVFGGGKTLRFTSRIYPLIGTSAERSQWYKITFPYSTITTGSSAQWFMNSFDLHFGGGYASNPSGVAHVTFYWTRAANNGAWAVGLQAALIEGILANKIGLYYRIAEPGVLYVNNTANTYNGIWIDNLYVDDTAINLNWSTITITATAAITESTSPKLSDYIKITTSYLYNDGGTLKTDSNFEGKYIKGTWLYTSAATAKTSTSKLATIESDNFIYYITPANALKSAIGTTAIGAAKTPIYWDGSKFTGGTALKNLAYKDSLTASDIPDLSGTYVKKVTSTDNAIVRFDGTDGLILNSGAIIDDNNNISVSSILSSLYSGYNLCKLQTSASGTEIVIKTKFKFVNSATMPSIRIHGYSYGKGAPLDLTIVYYIYSSEFYVPKVISTGGVSPDIYLFTYTENSIKYVAIGIKSSLGYLGFTVDANGGALGGLNINPDSTLCTTGWTIEHNGSNTSNTLIPAVNTDNCKLVPYLALSTTVEKAISANLTSTTNAVAYYTDTTGKFGSKASANGALYATSANGALQWGTLPIALGGTGKTTANDAANALISGLPTWTASPTADTYFIRRDTGGTATFGLVKFSSIANITNGKITLGPYSITPVTSVNGHTGSSVSVTAADLGLSKAMRFIGVATVAITDGSTTDPVISGYSTKTAGDVIIDKDSSREYIWSTTGKWELLGGDSSYKTTQTAVTDPTASTSTSTTFIDTISLDANGVITATKKTLPKYAGSSSAGGAATSANALNFVHTNELLLGNANSQSGIHINHRRVNDGESSGNTAITDYYFKNGNGAITGVTIHAATFSGNAATATGISKTGGSTANFWRGDNNWSSTLTGSLTISKAGECGLEVINSQTTNSHKGFFGGGSSGNLGIYDRTYNKWIVYSDPSGNAVLNGNANTATSAGKWTTARTLTIGSTDKSVDGSGNVSWSLTEIGAAASSHTHGNISNDGKITTAATIAANDYIIIGDNSNGGKLAKGLVFDGSTTSKALSQKGTWETFLTSHSNGYGKITSGAASTTTTSITTNTATIEANSANEKLTIKAGNKWIQTGVTNSNTAGSDVITLGHFVPASAISNLSTTALTPAFGNTFNIPTINLDEAGHVTSVSNTTVKIPELPSSMTPSAHTHGNISNTGTLGTTASYGVATDANKKIIAIDLTVTDPAASGNATTFVTSVTQSSQGKISVSRSTIPSASSTTAGIVKLGAEGGAATYGHTHSNYLTAHSKSYGGIQVSALSTTSVALVSSTAATTVTAVGANETVKFVTKNKWIVIKGVNSATAGADEVQFAHTAGLTAKTSYCSTSATASANGGKITVTDIQYDEAGHITSTTDRTITLSLTTYSLSSLGAASSTHVHGNISNTGTISTSAAPVNGDAIVISTSASGGLVKKTNITFDGSTTSAYLNKKGDWGTPPDTKNTAGSTATATKIFLIGATALSASPQTYSTTFVYATDGIMSAEAFGINHATTANKVTLQWNNTDSSLDFVFA